MKKSLCFLVLFTITSIHLLAQCPTISGPSTATVPCYGTTQVTLTANYSANITSQWYGINGEPIASIGTATSVVNLGSAGTFSAVFKDNSSNCVVVHTVQVNGFVSTIGFCASSFTQQCTNSTVAVSVCSIITAPVPNVPLQFTFMPTSVTSTPTTFTANPNAYSINSCGNWVVYVLDQTNNCVSSETFVIGCSSFSPSPISVAGSAATLCLGSSVTYTASGVNTYTWSNGPTTSTMNAIPLGNTTYVVSGTDPNGCVSNCSVSINPNPGCAMVWPGDANSDGIVDNLDPFEIGLAMSQSQTARTTTSNAFVSTYATAWTGTVSTGKNLCHADCNGNGVINNSDNTAITNNFSLTHAFRPSEINSPVTDLTIVPQQSVGYIGEWNTVDIYFGNPNSPISNLYGVAYQLNFDSAFVENNSTIAFNQSFLNDVNQNITFDKLIYNDQKHYITNVRINKQNVSGNGKIGEFTFKVKAGTSQNSVLNLSALNVVMIDSIGTRTTLSGGTTTLNLINDPNGINELKILESALRLYPNPTYDELNIKTELSGKITYSVVDILGNELVKNSFEKNTTLHLGELPNGTYVVKLNLNKSIVYKKVLVGK